MSIPHGQAPDDQALIRYLLGDLKDDEAERLDELSVADDEVASRLNAVENDLVDGFVRHELSGETLDRFRTHYLSSATRREKVRFAETLAAYRHADEPAHGATRRRTLSWPLPALAAAALLILATAGYLLVDGVRLRNQVAAAQSARATLEERERQLQRQLEEQRSAREETQKELAQLRAALAQAQPRTGANQPGGTSAPPRDLHVAAFVLVPPTRGAAALPVISPRAGTDYVVLQLPLESNELPAYQALLRDPAANRIIWRSRPLNAYSSGGTPTVSVGLPADVLKAQRYSLDLVGVGDGSAGTAVASYAFRVQPDAKR
jgi:hypothetical protein